MRELSVASSESRDTRHEAQDVSCRERFIQTELPQSIAQFIPFRVNYSSLLVSTDLVPNGSVSNSSVSNGSVSKDLISNDFVSKQLAYLLK